MLHPLTDRSMSEQINNRIVHRRTQLQKDAKYSVGKQIRINGDNIWNWWTETKTVTPKTKETVYEN